MIAALVGAVLVGVSLGLLGSGGAILTVPILVYLVGHDEKTAIVESLAIVGAIALFGAVRAWQRRGIDARSAALLAVPGAFGAMTGAWVAGWVPGAVQLAVLAVFMLAAAVLMLRPVPLRPESDEPTGPGRSSLAMVQGFGLGTATGLLGVGGGFLIVPVLVLLRRLPMSEAVGTSLAIIAVNCAVGLGKYLAVPGRHGIDLDWGVVSVFIGLGILGSVLGASLGRRLDQHKLRRLFGLALVVVAGYVLFRQVPVILAGAGEEAGPGEARTGEESALVWEPSAALAPLQG